MPTSTRVILGFTILQALLLTLGPAEVVHLASYLFVLAAPLLALGITLWRLRTEVEAPARWGWACMAVNLALWSAGQAGNLWWEWGLGHFAVLNRAILLVFHLTTVPLLFLLARPGADQEGPLVRGLDAAVALMIALTYYGLTWGTLRPANAPDAPAVSVQLWLMDAQNLYLLMGLLVRWSAAARPAERGQYGMLAVHIGMYALLASANNHLTSWYPSRFTPVWGSLITLAFLVLAWLAWPQAHPAPGPGALPSRRWQHVVHSAGPLILSGTLLLLALLLIRLDYAWGVAGVLLATGSSALRGTLTQVHQRLQGDSLQREHAELERIARTDALTGVPNRHHLTQVLARLSRPERRRSAPRAWAVLMIDIDHFKLLNDRQGHRYGDTCLREVAQALKATLQRPDDLLVRYGGEEFLALIPETTPQGVGLMAERLRAAVDGLALPHPATAGGRVTVSVGWAFHDDGTLPDFEALIARADQALYQAKREGRNRVAGQA